MKKNISHELNCRLMASVVGFLAHAGATESATRVAFSRAIKDSRAKRAGNGGRSSRVRTDPQGDVTAHLLRVWHRDSRLISNRDLNPKALPLSKGRHNLKSLIRTLDPEADPSEVLKTMRAVGLIRRTSAGRYLPTANAAVIPRLHHWAVEHAAHSVIRLISTVYRNATREAEPLLERYSYVPDLNPAEAQEFAAFARQQGQGLLDTLDDWLELRRLRTAGNGHEASKSGIPAGVHLITFLGDQGEVRLRRAAKMPARQSAGRNRPVASKRRLTSPPSAPS